MAKPVVVGLSVMSYIVRGQTGPWQTPDLVWQYLKHALSENVKSKQNLDARFAHGSIFFCMVKKSGEIGKDRDKIEFRA